MHTACEESSASREEAKGGENSMSCLSPEQLRTVLPSFIANSFRTHDRGTPCTEPACSKGH